MNVLASVMVLVLVVAALPSSGDIIASPGQGPRFLFCPGYKARDPGPSSSDLNRGRGDPLWLLQREDEWIPFKSDFSSGGGKKKFFGCFIYNLAAFGHYILDYFFPYYGYPYYRVPFEPSFGSDSSSCRDDKGHPSPDC